MTLAQALRAATLRLRDGGIEGAARDARALLASAVAIAPERILIEGDTPFDAEASQRLDDMIARRLAREPVARILGTRQFWGREFTVTPDVLDPRPETETLIVQALSHPAPTRLLDLGTGSGIIAVTLLAEWPEALGVACDISAAALGVAGENARRHMVQARLDLVQSDWFDKIEGAFDLILANPPYIAQDEIAGLAREVREHDPMIALSPGADGLSPYRTLAQGAGRHLSPGGRMIVEIGPSQGAQVARIFTDAGLAQVTVGADMDGRDRVVSGEMSP